MLDGEGGEPEVGGFGSADTLFGDQPGLRQGADLVPGMVRFAGCTRIAPRPEYDAAAAPHRRRPSPTGR